MNVFVYSDESGVFDKAHNDYYVYGGVLFLSKESRDVAARKYSHVESVIRQAEKLPPDFEIKASKISNKHKGSIYRSLNSEIKFGVVIEQKNIHDRIFASKKSKQRYLDYAFKRGVKTCFNWLIREERIDKTQMENMYFFIDEHTTATDGKYELRESLEEEFKHGCFNLNYNKYFEPLFPGMNGVQVDFCNSSSTTLVRAADIVANRLGLQARNGERCVSCENNLYVMRLP